MKGKRKLFGLLLCIVMIFSMYRVTKAEQNSGDGSIQIPVTIVWNGNADSQESRPESITISLYRYLDDPSAAILVESKDVSSLTGWMCNFTVPYELYYIEASNTTYNFLITQSAFSGYVETVHVDPVVQHSPFEVNEGWQRITPCNQLEIPTYADENQNPIIASKKGNDVVIWSARALTANEQNMVIDSIEANVAGMQNSNFQFINGYGDFPAYGMNISPGLIQYYDQSDWSFFAIGSYNESSTTVTGGSLTNTRNTYGALIVEKIIAGNGADADKQFEFTITLTDSSINGQFSEVLFTSGVATIFLKGSESKTIEGLPNGVGFTVTETDYTADGYITVPEEITGVIVGDTEVTASFTNTRNSDGSLTISKKLEGYGADYNKEFKFTIVLNEAISGTFSEVVFTDGIAVIFLKGGQSKFIEGLPNGIGYTVTESDNDGYNTTAVGASGTIDENKASLAEFTNTRKWGILTIVKMISGNAADVNKVFEFTITLSDESINDTIDGVTFINGVATIGLKGTESKTIRFLPAGIDYSVSEEDYSDEGYVTTSTETSGTITEGQIAEVVFTNTRNVYELTIGKMVLGDGADIEKYFTFTVNFASEAVYSYHGSKTGTISNGGKIQLKHNEYITIEGLPEGIEYSIVESDNEGYQVFATAHNGTLIANTSAQFVNRKDKVPETGDNSKIHIWTKMMVLSLAGIIALEFGKRKMLEKYVSKIEDK